jgi:hypothetical protein
MATLQQVNAVVSGFPRALAWTQFRAVDKSPSPPMQALTSSSYQMGPWRVAVTAGEYRVQGIRIAVSLNTNACWAVGAARTNAALLRHEQGHYDITGLVARDLASNVLDLSLEASVVAAMKDAGRNEAERLRYVQRQFQTSVNDYGRQAADLLNRLQTNPTTHRDGIYDVQTQHGVNAAAQSRWESLFARVKTSGTSFRLALALMGI